MAGALYSIGYATKPVDTFIKQLANYRIGAIADVRSVPYSKRFHQYHRETLKGILKSHGIHYVYLGDELGPRSKDDNHYNECGQVQFDRLMNSDLFHQGIERLQNGLAKDMNIALLCAEKDPAQCHRSLLVGYYLRRKLNMELAHIHHDGELESQQKLEQRLAVFLGTTGDLFSTPEQQLELAWEKQCALTSYIKPESED
ncbi:DUF488 domain-containing protein [Porticoccus sp. W117]|uniref:DUF488 domain-containing protein n=1 Tax=Porticoccus sp. W117 TaxID=3054777 RepID=UPI002591626C|nr:DUF488 domain-containing protein [Porticoccus sp. W117]MDM3870763.1 DUF488 domain-containing protein [Porticoccus sp. W117]